ncbi:MAG TPA: hypothetical protein VGJ28_20290, partial [Micromonosporaceae bacterium]
MSRFDELSAELCAVSDHLPLPSLRRAVATMRQAGDQLIHAIRLAATIEAAPGDRSTGTIGAASGDRSTGSIGAATGGRVS